MQEWFLDDINSCCATKFGGCVECEVTDNKGRILKATRSFRKGELILQETPLHIAVEDHKNVAFQTVKRICDKDTEEYYEPLWYWAGLSSLTTKDLNASPPIGKLSYIDKDRQQRLLSLYHEPVTEASAQVKEIVAELHLSVDPVLVEELLQVWVLNCFEHSEDPPGYSAYYVSSFCSHSCYPNACWSLGRNDSHVLKARRAISKGDEICISYLEEHSLLECAEVRKQHLYETKLFHCTCERCEPQEVNEDPCRGFRCAGCGQCTIFHRLRKKKGQGLRGLLCTSCGVAVNATRAAELIAAEEALQLRLAELDTECQDNGRDVVDVMLAQEMERLLQMIEDDDEAVLGPQHWLCDKLWRYAIDFFTDKEMLDTVDKLQRLRTEYRSKAYRKPGRRSIKKEKTKKYKWIPKSDQIAS